MLVFYIIRKKRVGKTKNLIEKFGRTEKIFYLCSARTRQASSQSLNSVGRFKEHAYPASRKISALRVSLFLS